MSIHLAPRLDWCMKHHYEPCECPAWLIVMGCMDAEIEEGLERGDSRALAAVRRVGSAYRAVAA